ncbi:MAG: 3-dehydroquinate dehydratase [Bdellovibrionaceae bacterium]|nr:3-dehydroquinate dehydratase [Pseudobdellovibrionaceae bacterium]|tara:strand:+ start:1837 stop:2268 length:432 start_codon:yes stop_codon:yes gene_type:complete
MKNVMIVNGPNLNLLGERDVLVYGEMTLLELNSFLIKKFSNLEIRTFQSNHEGQLIDWIQENRNWADGLVINPAGYTHTSIALRDTVEAIRIPSVEVHLSNIKNREPFRMNSFFSDVCVASFMGKKELSYVDGINFLLELESK